MSIGKKILILQTLLIFSFMTCIFVITHYIWGGNYLKLEQSQVKENVLRSSLAWSEEKDHLNSLVEDWAPWDELYSFVDHLDEPFAKHNLTDSAMANLQINVAIITDREGKVLYAKSVDLNEKIEVVVSQEIVTEVSNLISQRKNKLYDQQGINGFFATKDYPIFVAVQRILPSDRQGESNGFLIFLKFADQAMIDHLSQKTQVDLNFFNG